MENDEINGLNSWLFYPQFPQDWQKTKLYPTAEWLNGLAFKDKHFSNKGIHVIKIAEVKQGIIGQTKRTLQEFDAKFLLNNGDLLFCWSGQPETSIDAYFWQGQEGWLNQHVFKVTPESKFDTKFFYYILKYLKPNFVQIARNKQTTGLGHVTKGNLKEIQIAYPPLAEQQAIAGILGALDDKIELNRRMNGTLEGMARAVFKSWFVDFDPVRAKLEGRPPPGLDPATAALFPDSFEEQDGQRIPKGWRIGSVYELAEVVYGAPFASKQFNEDQNGTPLIRIRDLKTQQPQKYTRQVHPKGTKVTPGDILVGMDAEFRMHIWSGPESWLNQRVCMFVPKQISNRYFLALSIEKPLDFYERAKVGTTVIHLGKGDIDNFEVLKPSTPILESFGKLSEPLVDLSIKNNLESQTLANLRDTLLPKLLSGEIRVQEAEKAVETVL